jgi:hypothetical protein
MAKFLRLLYTAVTYSFYFAIFCLMIILFGSKLILGRFLYYGNSKISVDDKKYLSILEFLETSILYISVFWIFLTLFVLISKELPIYRKLVKVGLMGIILSVIYFFVDPFGTLTMLMK